MKKYLFTLILIICGVSYGQKNILYAEYGGAGYLGTFNYERMLTKNIITRIGYGSYDQEVDVNISKNSNISFYPIGLSYITDLDKEQIEFGGGMTVLNGDLEMNGEEIDPDAGMIFFGAGYRYHFQEIGVLLGLKGYYLSLDGLGAPWAGITLGWSF